MTQPESIDRPKRRRKPTEERIREIIEAASDHFAEVGFEGGTREIAKRAGITQPLLYRYFPDKNSLIEAVYKKVYLESWEAHWDQDILRRNIPVRERFVQFYKSYIATHFTPRWLRITYYASLRNSEIQDWYGEVIEELILKQMVREHRCELGYGDSALVSSHELALAWQMHGGLLHFGLRRFISDTPSEEEIDQAIYDALDSYLCFAPKVYDRHGS